MNRDQIAEVIETELGRFLRGQGEMEFWRARFRLAADAIMALDGWQTIDSAPRDGTLLLLYCPSGIDRLYASPEEAANYCIGRYGDAGGMYRTEGWFTIESRAEIWGYGSEMTGPMTETECLACAPTHFRHLPQPPGDAG